MKITYYTNKSF